MADLHPERFAEDVVDQPRVLAEPAASVALVEPLARRARRVLFLGMGSSRFAALDASTRLRAHGVDASAEIASTGLPSPRRPTRSCSRSRPRADPQRRSLRCAGMSA